MNFDGADNEINRASSYGSQPPTSDNIHRIEVFGGIRTKRPLISGAEMRERLEGRKILKLSQIKMNVNHQTKDINGDWVTIAVIAQKLPPKISKNGKSFSIIKLSDLSWEKQMSLFLFGDAHETHWKLSVGTVVGLLNSKIMLPEKSRSNSKKSDASSSDSEISLSLDSALKLLPLGIAKDMSYCKAVKKDSQPCNQIVNISLSQYCSYHLSSAYKKLSAQRSELQGLFGDAHSRSSFDAASAGHGPPKRSCPNIKVMNGIRQERDVKFSANNLFNEPAVKETSDDTQHIFRAGASLVKAALKCPITLAARNLSMATGRDINKSEIDISGNSVRLNPNKKLSANEVLAKMGVLGRDTPSSQPSQVRSRLGPRVPIPSLGRGFRPGDSIDLSMDAKKEAAARVLKIKPITKENPNAVRPLRKSTDSAADDSLHDCSIELEQEPMTQMKCTVALPPPSKPLTPAPIDAITFKRGIKRTLNTEKSSEKIPSDTSKPNKKTKLSSALLEIINRKSKHESEVKDAERVAEEKYFEVMERKEAVEERMLSTISMEVTVVHCPTCGYTAQSQSELCKNRVHKVTWRKAVKKFFRCSKCQFKTFTYDEVVPLTPCTCGQRAYEKASAYNIKDNVKLPREELKVRGEEHPKFLNSLQ